MNKNIMGCFGKSGPKMNKTHPTFKFPVLAVIYAVSSDQSMPEALAASGKPLTYRIVTHVTQILPGKCLRIQTFLSAKQLLHIN